MNIPTLVVLIIVAAVFSAIAIKEVKDKKRGKSLCSCGCEGCAMNGSCRGKTE